MGTQIIESIFKDMFVNVLLNMFIVLRCGGYSNYREHFKDMFVNVLLNMFIVLRCGGYSNYREHFKDMFVNVLLNMFIVLRCGGYSNYREHFKDMFVNFPLTHCKLSNFSCFFDVCWFFFKLIFQKKFFQEYYQNVKQFGPWSGPTNRRAWSGSKLFAKVNSRRHW